MEIDVVGKILHSIFAGGKQAIVLQEAKRKWHLIFSLELMCIISKLNRRGRKISPTAGRKPVIICYPFVSKKLLPEATVSHYNNHIYRHIHLMSGKLTGSPTGI